jgi:hypothetical protein
MSKPKGIKIRNPLPGCGAYTTFTRANRFVRSGQARFVGKNEIEFLDSATRQRLKLQAEQALQARLTGCAYDGVDRTVFPLWSPGAMERMIREGGSSTLAWSFVTAVWRGRHLGRQLTTGRPAYAGITDRDPACRSELADQNASPQSQLDSRSFWYKGHDPQLAGDTAIECVVQVRSGDREAAQTESFSLRTTPPAEATPPGKEGWVGQKFSRAIRREAARLVGVSESLVYKAEVIARECPETIAAINRGETTVTAVYRAIRRSRLAERSKQEAVNGEHYNR